MAAIKLTYLTFRGRAELLRFMLAQAGVDFTDTRIEPKEWPEKMPGIQFGIPVLEFEGQTLQRNGTIAKFLAAKYNMAGSTDKEKAATEEIIDSTEATWDKMSSYFWQQDETKKAEIFKELIEGHLPATLKKLEITATKNNSENGWIVGQNVTYADFAIAVMLDTLAQFKPELVSLFAALAKLKKSVEELPNIAKWIANRPDTTH